MKYYIEQQEKKHKNYTNLELVYCITIKNVTIIIKILSTKHISINIYTDGIKKAAITENYRESEKSEFKYSLKSNLKSKFKINFLTLITIIIKIITLLK